MTTTILKGDCRDILKTLPDQSVHCCVTSPPYFGLRDYGTAKWDGGDADCDHRNDTQHQKQGATSARAGRSNVDEQRNENFRDICGKCGAVRIDSQIGLEATPDAFVAEMVAVFREVRRVLRDDGTLWLNLGDSYGAVGGNTAMTGGKSDPARGIAMGFGSLPKTDTGLRPKNLIGIPWRTAFALQADGWYLRQDIIWSKPNPMPESVTDRCTKAHEYIFLMSKKAKYFYDAEAIRNEPTGRVDLTRIIQGNDRTAVNFQKDGTVGCNKRSVWNIATSPYADAHFATFPPDLIEPCIKAGCPPGGMVLDPFGGAGTTGLVADRLQRNATLIELNPEYADMARRRIIGDAPLFADAAE